jgi:hypothetical protein
MVPRGTQGAKSNNPPSLALRRVKAERKEQRSDLAVEDFEEIMRFMNNFE